jgi:hypothetical protein
VSASSGAHRDVLHPCGVLGRVAERLVTGSSEPQEFDEFSSVSALAALVLISVGRLESPPEQILVVSPTVVRWS